MELIILIQSGTSNQVDALIHPLFCPIFLFRCSVHFPNTRYCAFQTFYLSMNLQFTYASTYILSNKVSKSIFVVVGFLTGAVGLGIVYNSLFSMFELISSPFLFSSPTYSEILLVIVTYLSDCLQSLHSIIYTSISVHLPLNFGLCGIF